MNKTRGFTLIELLIIIAILGILASIVIASLRSARDKGDDAAIKADLNQIRVASDLVYDDLGNAYCDSGTCVGGSYQNISNCQAVTPLVSPTYLAEDAKINAELVDAVLKNGGIDARCVIGVNGYAIAVPLKTNSSLYWCVDSQGISKQTSSLPVDDTPVCP